MRPFSIDYTTRGAAYPIGIDGSYVSITNTSPEGLAPPPIGLTNMLAMVSVSVLVGMLVGLSSPLAVVGSTPGGCSSLVRATGSCSILDLFGAWCHWLCLMLTISGTTSRNYFVKHQPTTQ